MKRNASVPAIFLDRDGTINEDIGYVSQPHELVIYPWAAEAIRMINQSGMKALVITNQSAVARGFCSEEEIRTIHNLMTTELGRYGARLDGIYYCPHHPEVGQPPYRTVCDCRKPLPGLALAAAREHNIDLKRSYVVGDKLSDMDLARNIGARPALVLTGYGLGTKAMLDRALSPPQVIAGNLLEAVTTILRNWRSEK